MKKIDIFLIFAQNIDCGILTSTPNPWFRGKKKKKKKKKRKKKRKKKIVYTPA